MFRELSSMFIIYCFIFRHEAGKSMFCWAHRKIAYFSCSARIFYCQLTKTAAFVFVRKIAASAIAGYKTIKQFIVYGPIFNSKPFFVPLFLSFYGHISIIGFFSSTKNNKQIQTVWNLRASFDFVFIFIKIAIYYLFLEGKQNNFFFIF